MSDLNETLAGMRKEWTNPLGLIDGDVDALLSAVENVLALCDGKPYFTGFGTDGETIHGVLVADVRKALTDALGSEPSNSRSER